MDEITHRDTYDCTSTAALHSTLSPSPRTEGTGLHGRRARRGPPHLLPGRCPGPGRRRRRWIRVRRHRRRSDMDTGGMLLQDFGQWVDPTRRIHEVLANYPEGTTALWELIQNADDAGASRVRLCLDRRAHGARLLLAPALAQWQGPALLAHNAAAFTDDDFASISRIGGNKKDGR